MKRIATLSALALSLFVTSVQAGEWTLKDWLKDLDAKINRVERKQKSRMTAAAAVRGAKQDQSSSKKLYWKGKKTAQPVTQQELDEFKASVALAQEGKNEDVEKSLTAFMQKHPDSALAPDAQKTLALLKQSPAPESTPAETK